jgi:hypothetical protein
VLFVGGTIIVSLLVACNIQVATAPRIEGLETPDRELPSILIVSGMLVYFTGAMLWLAGLCMWCVAPPESGTRPIAAGAALCWFLFLVVGLQIPTASVGVRLRTPRFAEQGRRDGEPVRMVYGSDNGAALAAAMLAIAGGCLTMGCLCAMAHRFHNERLASGARWFILFQIVTLPALVFLFFLHHYVAEIWRHQPWYLDGPPYLFVAFAIALGGCVWLLRLMTETRRMLRTAEEIAHEKPLAA